MKPFTPGHAVQESFGQGAADCQRQIKKYGPHITSHGQTLIISSSGHKDTSALSVIFSHSHEVHMHRILFLLILLVSVPAWAAPWIFLEPATISGSGSVTIDAGKKLGPISALRFQIDGATVHLESLTLVPVKGDSIPLRVPQILKSGEASGLIRIPGQAILVDELRLKYRIPDRRKAIVTMRLRPVAQQENATLP